MLFQMCVVILQDGFALLHGITNNSKILKKKNTFSFEFCNMSCNWISSS